VHKLKKLQPFQNWRSQKGDMKLVPQWGRTNISRYRTKSIRKVFVSLWPWVRLS